MEIESGKPILCLSRQQVCPVRIPASSGYANGEAGFELVL
jgi:hypothetical protein